MNEEIKEILDRFKKVNVNSLCPFEMEASDCKKILDYITNLQKENKKISKQHLSTINKLIETQQENERLKQIVVEKDNQLKDMIMNEIKEKK